jgi:opacity protein-like surface antigen
MGRGILLQAYACRRACNFYYFGGGEEMLRKTERVFIKCLVFVLFAYSSAVADTPVLNSKDGKLYASIDVGLTLLNDIGFGAYLSGYGSTATAAGTFTFDEAVSYGGAIGYVISDFVRAELELGYQKVDHDKLDYTGNITTAGTTTTFSGETDVSGEIDALTVSTNVILTPLGNKNLFGVSITPLVGAGIGVVNWEDEIKTVGTHTVNSKEDDTDLLVSIMAGLEYTSSQWVTWAINYRHAWVDSGKNGVDDAEADNVMANIKIAF